MKKRSSKSSITLIISSLIALFLPITDVWGQSGGFSRQDSLRGSITPAREWWNLTYYQLDVVVKPEEQAISGVNTIYYSVLNPSQIMQIDLQPPMKITKVLQGKEELSFERDGNAWFIGLKEEQLEDAVNHIVVYFEGKPKVSEQPPWSGGWVWDKDGRGNHFIANANQGEGASLWWPCKDHMYDEVDSMQISVNVPDNLIPVSNGRLRRVVEKEDGTSTFHWFVSNPINNYGVNINIGDYVNFGEQFKGEKGLLDCSYYVLRDNLSKAKKQFSQVKMMLQAFEHWFGPYPFYEDGYKLVEVPYLGMEHQSSVTYGNGYGNGYLGRDLSRTGHGMKFDFIIIHESGHEWFANNITNRDIADMWIHEGFTAYSESLYLEYHFGKKAAGEYVRGTRSMIQHDRPLIGPYGVNKEGSQDMYYKGANMLHTLRQIIGDDNKWRDILRGLNKEFYHQTVSSQQIEQFLNKQTTLDLGPFFDQYLRGTRVPILEYRFIGSVLEYRWANCVDQFAMPVKVFLNKQEILLFPTTDWAVLEGIKKGSKLITDPNYYIALMDLTVGGR